MNRLLLAATTMLRNSTSRPDLIASLGTLASRMGEVASVRFDPRRVPTVSLDRRHAHFEPAVRLAELVLRHMSMAFRAGSICSATFLVDMNLLYERFVVAAIERYLGPRRTRWSRHPKGLYLDQDREIRIIPDAILHDERHRPVVVVDAKYKSATSSQREDVFQMSTYCSRLDIQHAVLVYAATDEGRYRLEGGVTIHRYPLGIDGDIDDLERRIARLTAFIESLPS